MPEPFKEKFNTPLVSQLANAINRQWPDFKSDKFISDATSNLDSLELKARSNQIKQALLTHMPNDFAHCAQIVTQCLAPASKDETIVFETRDDGIHGIEGWILMPVTDFITEQALVDKTTRIEDALSVLHACTQRFSAEFSIRPLLRDYTTETLEVLHKWAVDPSAHVRRLVSEGTRPYLPWGLRLKCFVKEPDLVLPLLEKLKEDPSEYVRRSVANHLNDIAKDHPDLVVKVAQDWWEDNNIIRLRLLKHACRTLIKNGHAGALALFGYPPATLNDISFTLESKQVKNGQHQTLSLHLTNAKSASQNIMLDYAVYHQKAKGKLSPKVFKWSSFVLQGHETKRMQKQHSFKPVTTRKYYPGLHKIEILINGKVAAIEEFQLLL